jgi:PAS domain S-box-containing protein
MKTGYDFLAGGGEMGKVLRAMDWSRTPLGPIERWPQSLRTTVSLCLASNFPISIAWGLERVQIYNDGYWPICGAKHPHSMGQDFRECWFSAWPAIGSAFDQASAGQSAFLENQRMFLDRNGYLEETFFTFSFSPIRDESGGVGGLFHPVTELTQQSLAERRLQVLRDLADRASDAKSVEEACALITGTLAHHELDLPFALLYLAADEGREVRLAGASGLAAGTAWSPTSIDFRAAAGCWPLRSQRMEEIDGLAARFGPLSCGPYPEAPTTALVLPISAPGLDYPLAYVVAGVSSRRALDQPYRTFYAMLQDGVTSSLVNARAYEQERKRAEALAELDRAKTAFFSNISHEFRTPLTLILGPIEDGLADVEQPMPGAQRERLELARRSSLRLQKLVNTLLDFSRIEAGRAQASFVPTDLAALTADIASNFRSAIEKAGLRLRVDCPALREPAYVDSEMWEKIVLNLLSNAFKFTFEGEITLALRDAGGSVELAVRDTGTGIPAAELPHVFERFRRVEGARSRTHEGTGIGLALVQELTRLHGGTVRVESAAGEGSVFTVSIPTGQAHLPAERIGAAPTLASTALRAESYVEEALRWLPDEGGFPAIPGNHAEGSGEIENTALPGLRRERIVWADDNADMREYVRRLLTTRYDVEAVADGEAALAAARARRPDLLIADVMMPKLDGLSLVRALRQDPATRSIPAILLSARAGQEARIEGFDAGADDYLYKPFSARELLARVSARLELHRLSGHLAAERTALADLFAQTPIPTAVLKGPGLVFEMANPAYAAVVGNRDVVGKPLLEALPEIKGQGFDTLLHGVMRTGVPHIGRETLVRLERSRGIEDVYFNFIYAPLRGADGNVDGAIVIAVEVTEQVLARKKAEESEERFRNLADNISQLAWMAEANGWIFWYNRRWFDYTGTTLEEMQGWGWKKVHHPDHIERVVTRIQHSWDTGETWEDTFPLRGREGEYRWFLSRAQPIRDAGGKVLRWFGTNTDVTRQRAADEALKEADRRKDVFIATLSHELRNPLAPIRNAVQLLRDADDDPEIRAQARGILERQVRHTIRLVDDLLDLSRVTLGTMSLEKQELDLADVLHSAVEISRPHIDAAGHRLEIAMPAEPVRVLADAVRLAQVVANLLNNAAKYTPEGGRIALAARGEGESAVITVRDNGAGIPADMLERVFDTFAQVDMNLRRAQGGLGIGLSLSKRLVELHGGSIEARSEGAGRGSEFTVRVPRAASDQPRASLPASARKEGCAIRRRVLVVDDNIDAAESLGMLLRQMGHEVRLAHDGGAALEAADRNPPEILLLDLDLPKIDGYGVAERLRRDSRFKRLRVIALTGYGQDSDRARSREAGFDEHLVKPIDPEALRGLFERAN